MFNKNHFRSNDTGPAWPLAGDRVRYDNVRKPSRQNNAQDLVLGMPETIGGELQRQEKFMIRITIISAC